MTAAMTYKRLAFLLLLQLVRLGTCFECSWIQLRQLLPGDVMSFTSPNYPDSYPPLHKCFAKFTPANTNTTVRLICHDVEIYQHTGFFSLLTRLVFGDDWVILATGNVVQPFPSGIAAMPTAYSVSSASSLLFGFGSNLFGSSKGFSCTVLATDNQEVTRTCGQKGKARSAVDKRKRRSLLSSVDVNNVSTRNGSRQAVDLTKIFGGQAAEDNEWPWMAFLSVMTSSGDFYCGGTFISSTCILTAAHCFQNMVAGTQVTIRYGQSNLASGGVQVTMSSEVVSHPAFSQATDGKLHNDIAIVKLAAPVVFNTNVQPICLPTYSDRAERYQGTAEITGWGKLRNASPSVTPSLQEAEAKMIDLVTCRERTGDGVNITQLCSDPVTGMSVCPGDSGSPLKRVEKDGKYTQIGLVSFGSTSCEEDGRFAVYTRVDMYLEWISQTCSSATVYT